MSVAVVSDHQKSVNPESVNANKPSQTCSAFGEGVGRVVVKVGSSLVTDSGCGLDAQAIDDWCVQLAQLSAMGFEIVLVSSGAIAEGVQRLGWQQRPAEIRLLQAAAAVGQMGLVQMYESSLRRHELTSAQVLLTHEDMRDRERYLNARSTLLALMQLGVITVINENDTVVTEEIKFGDNDTLAALVANLVDADVLVILTDQPGLYDSDPRSNPKARFIRHALAGDKELEQMAGGAGTAVGTGGMYTKVIAAKRASRSGTSTVIASGREPDVLLRLARGEAVGTYLQAKTGRMQARKQWMADHLKLHGAVVADAGAVAKMREGRASLLPVGVTAVKGQFSRGDVIAIHDAAGTEVARGLASHSSSEVQLICGRASAEVAKVLGYAASTEVVHKNNLLLSDGLPGAGG